VSFLILQGDANHIPLRDESVQCVVTSPPYWGLRAYLPDADPLKRHELGLEPVHDCLGWATGNPCGECYVCHMVAVFREVKRVLRKDGVVWLNLGDSYAGSGKGHTKHGTVSGYKQHTNRGSLTGMPAVKLHGLKPKDLVGIPWRVAFALQADGWWLRSDIIWAKGVSFCEAYAGSAMPESVTDRPTKAHEYVFLLTKSKTYYYDHEAVREPQQESSLARARYGWAGRTDDGSGGARTGSSFQRMAASGEPIATIPADGERNLRDVWAINPANFKDAHFATFPPALVEPCIKAGTSERGACPRCGAPWEREVDREPMEIARSGRRDAMGEYGRTQPSGTMVKPPTSTTIGWRPTCSCNAGDPVPCVVLDPFSGAGTTVLVADRLGRNGVGLDLSGTYTRMGRDRVFNDAPLLALMGAIA
jgi:DNA modification methylase